MTWLQKAPSEHTLEVGTGGGQDKLVGMYLLLAQRDSDVAEVPIPPQGDSFAACLAKCVMDLYSILADDGGLITDR